MPISERKKETNRNWLRRNTQLVGCNLYKEDVEALKAEALRRGTTINALLRDSVAEILGRPLTKRS